MKRWPEWASEATAAASLAALNPFPRSENNCFLYGVFNGYDGNRVTNFVAQRLSAELLLGQLSAEHTEADVRRVLLQVQGSGCWGPVGLGPPQPCSVASILTLRRGSFQQEQAPNMSRTRMRREAASLSD